ncbi:MAG: hypothetical protein K5899_04725 [Bacteroidaceae bacterium]|nr:hypothetical protein [Bacteroidaceae bacterium]
MVIDICLLPNAVYGQSLGEGLTNPKIEALKDFFQSYGIRIDPRFVNAGSRRNGDHELQLDYRFAESVYPTVHPVTGEYIGNHGYSTSYQDGRSVTLLYKQSQAIYEKVLATIEELKQDARQYNRWEYHEDDADTIQITMVLNGGMGSDEIETGVSRAYRVPFIDNASEHIQFTYTRTNDKTQVSHGRFFLLYTCVIDTVKANKMLDIKKFLTMVSPAVEPLSDKRRFLHYQHDETMYQKYTWRQVVQFFTGNISQQNGETTGMDIVFNTREKAEQALQNLKQSIAQYIRLYPDEGIEFYPGITWGGSQLLFRSMFSRSTMYEMRFAKELELHIVRDSDAGKWHLLFFVTRGELLYPLKWQTIHSSNNMEFEYD